MEGDDTGPGMRIETPAGLARLLVVLENYRQQPDNGDRWQMLLGARRTAGEVVGGLHRKETKSPVVMEACRLVREMLAWGVYDRVTEAEDLARAAGLAPKGWPGLLAAMLLAPAWSWASALRLQDVPDWLVGDYVRWIFTAPKNFVQPGEAETYAKHVRVHLADLAGWVQRSPGSAAVRQAAEIFLDLDCFRALAASAGDLRVQAELRGVIARRMLGPKKADFQPVTIHREGRRLRVGVVAEHFGVSPETRLILPLCSQLDARRFEMHFYARSENFSALENQTKERPVTWVLPADEAEQLSVLRAAELDVLVFGTNLSARLDGLSRLALERMAPLQVALPLSVHTTGFSTVDLFVAGEQAPNPPAAEQFTERLGLWRGPSHVVDRELGHQAAGQAWTKASLGMAEDAVVFVSEAAYDGVTPEVIEAWAGLLAKVPGSQLILHPFGAGGVAIPVMNRFGTLVEAALRRHGVDTGRLLLSTLELTNPGDVQALLSVGDIYLEAFAANSVEGLLRALQAGLPVVTCAGKTLRAGAAAAWLHSLGLNALVCQDAAAYVATAQHLATDVAARTAAAATVKKKMSYLPAFADALAASDGFGSILENAFDLIVSNGAKAFAADRSPVRPAGLAPTDLPGRWALGKQLLAEGRASRAVEFLMAALSSDEGSPKLWLDVACALRANGQSQDAIRTLEIALRLDQTLVDGWKLLAELADLAMIPDLAAEARQIVDTLTVGRNPPAKNLTPVQPKVESIVGKLRSLRIARQGIV